MDLTRPLLVVALALPTLALATPAHAACSGDVMVQNPYSPASKEVAPGTTVTWCWTENNHSVTSDAVGGFDSGVQNTGATFQRTLNATVTYHCTIHSNMHGTIVVKQPTPPSPTPSRTVSHSPAPAPTTTGPATHTPSPPPSRTATPKPTPTPAPTPTATTAPPTTAPPTTVAPTTLAPTTTSPTPLVLDPPPAKPKTGLALVLGSVVAVGALGGAAWLFLKGRAG